ncbi:MAG: hypothetical protein ACREVY_15915 [Gammaproteobacteria bacterium]
MSWARLKWVFEIGHCPQCGGTLKVIAAIEHLPVITKILTHLGLPARAPPEQRPGPSIDSNWPDPPPIPLPSASAAEATLPLGPRSPETPKRLET